MKIWRVSLAGTPETAAQERRRHGRLRTEGTQCSLGEVLDISASGMRIARKGAMPVEVGESFRIDIMIDKDVFSLDVTVRRIIKTGRRKFEYGVEFCNLTDEARRELAYLARIAATSPRAMW